MVAVHFFYISFFILCVLDLFFCGIVCLVLLFPGFQFYIYIYFFSFFGFIEKHCLQIEYVYKVGHFHGLVQLCKSSCYDYFHEN